TAMTLVLNGPLAARLGVNARENALGHGFRANATIGRALRLLIMNVLEIRPGRNDRSTLGNPARYSFCFAENEVDSPWEPLHVERGFQPEQSTVSLFATIGQTTIRIVDDKDPEPSLLLVADGMSFLGSHNIMGQGEFLVVFAGELCGRCQAKGMGKAEVKRFLYDHARRKVADLKRTRRIKEPLTAEDESTWRHVTARPEDIVIVAAGSAVGYHAACLPSWGLENPIRSVTMPITVPGV
ncbi:MAG: hypothetical protein O7A08_06985, partial [SAR324 cluster bacterium]|nr:hypothetical protein [SAR324 cluster bacterium]